MPRIIAVGLLAVVASVPWFYGGVLAEHQFWAAVALAVLMVLQWVYSWSLPDESLRPDEPARVSPVMICLAVGLALNLAQLVPLSGGNESRFASQAAKLRAQLVDPPAAVQDATQIPIPAPRPTRTLYPANTRTHAALLAMAMAAFLLAVHHLSSREAIPWMLGGLTLLGGAFSLLGIVGRLSSNAMLYGQGGLGAGRTFGPMVNENNAGGFLNICLSAGIGWIVWWSWPQRDETDYGEYDKSLWARMSSLQRVRSHVADFFSGITADKLGALILTGIIAAGVLCTLSRGSVVAMVGGLVLLAVMLAARRQHRGMAFVIAGVLLAAVVVTMWAGQVGSVRAEMHSLRDEDLARSGRALHWPDALRTAQQFWGAGTGFGTYPYAYTAQNRMVLGESNFEHAENQYLEALVEGGLPALGLLLAAIGMAGGSAFYLLQTGHRTDTALGVAGLGALGTQALGGAFDFGLYVPANFLALAMLCGAVCGRVIRPWSDCRSRWLCWRWPVACDSALIGGLTMLVCCAAWELQSAATAETALRTLSLADLRESRDPEEIDRAVDRLVQAIPQRSDDAELHRNLAEALQQRFRIATYTELQQQSPYPPEVTSEGAKRQWDDQLWDRSGLWQLHRTVLQADANRDLVTAANLRGQSGVVSWLRPARDHFRISRAACPLIAHVHYALAELAPLFIPLEDAKPHLARARQLAPTDATMWFWSGMLEANSGDRSAAMTAWQQSLKLAPVHRIEICQALRAWLPLDQIVSEYLPPDPAVLMNFASQAFGQPQQAADRQTVFRRVQMLLADVGSLNGEQHYWLAQCQEGLGDRSEALRHYEAAVKLSPFQPTWRYQWAQLALQANDQETAFREATQLVRQYPDRSEYQQLLELIKRKMTE